MSSNSIPWQYWDTAVNCWGLVQSFSSCEGLNSRNFKSSCSGGCPYPEAVSHVVLVLKLGLLCHAHLVEFYAPTGTELLSGFLLAKVTICPAWNNLYAYLGMVSFRMFNHQRNNFWVDSIVYGTCHKMISVWLVFLSFTVNSPSLQNEKNVIWDAAQSMTDWSKESFSIHGFFKIEGVIGSRSLPCFTFFHFNYSQNLS